MRLFPLFVKTIFWLCILVATSNSENVENKLSYEMQLENILASTANFFTGLYDFEQFNNAEIQANETTFEKIDQIVDHYLYIIKKAHGLLPEEENKHNPKSKTLHRRNTPVDYIKDTIHGYALKGFEEITTIPAQHPIDIILFDQTFFDHGLKIIQYAATLENYNFGNQSSIIKSDELVLYKYTDGVFQKVFTTGVSKGTKLLSKTINGRIYVLVAVAEDYLSYDSKDWRGTTLFYVDIWKDVLTPIQMLTTLPAYDITFWDDFEHTYLGLAIGNLNLNKSNQIQSPIYRWMGAHFDIIDNLPMNDARKIIELTIDLDRYLVFANYKNDQGETAAYSPIYRYDLHQDRFVLHQRLSTYAAVDVKYFNITTDLETTHFLLVANQYETDFNGKKDYATTSILYKFSVNYFVPFQGFELYSATEWLTFKDPSGVPFLLVNCLYEGLRAFNYDGWRFTETPLEFGGGALGRGISSIRTQNFLGQPVLVVSNPTDNTNSLPNIFRPIFRPSSSTSSEKIELLSWCQTRLEQAGQLYVDDIKNKIDVVPKITDSVVELTRNIDFVNEVFVENLTTGAIWTDHYMIDDTVLRNIHNLHDDLVHHTGYVDVLLNKSLSLILTDEPIKLRGSLTAPKIMAPVSKIDQFEAKFVNNEDFDEIRHNILQNQLSDMLQFDELTVNTTLEFRFINGKPVDSLLFKNHDHRFEMLVLDNVSLQKYLSTGYVNNLPFNSDVLILNNTKQYFDYLDISTLKSRGIESTNLNSIQVENPKIEPRTHNLDGNLYITDLKTSTINGIYIDMIYQNALKNTGAQEILSEYEIQELQAANFDGIKISGISPKNLVNIREGSFVLDNEVSLKGPLKVEKDLKIMERLNNIPIRDGELQVLLKNSDKPQKILGNKYFESVELLDPIDLQGMINSSALDRMNPVSSVPEDLVLEGNIFLNGPVTIRKHLRSTDIIASLPNKEDFTNSPTILNLIGNGLPLNAEKISTRFVFTQPFKTGNLNTQHINSIPVETWVTSNHAPAFITAHKTFASGLQISKQCSLTGPVNGVNLNELLSNTLRTNSEQTQKVDGRTVFEKVHSISLSSPGTVLHSKPISNYLTRSTKQNLEGGVVSQGGGACKVRHLESKTVTTFASTEIFENEFYKKETLYEIMQSLYSDCMTGQDSRRAGAQKNFRNLTVGELNVNGYGNGLNLPEYSKLEINDVYGNSRHVEGPVHFSKPVTAHKLTFTGSLDGVGHQVFGSQWLLFEGEQVLSSPITVNSVTSQEPVIMNGALNGVSLHDLENTVLYTNKDYVLPKVDFVNGFESLLPIAVSGTISGLNFQNDIILKHSDEIQEITGKKTINGQLVINGVPHLTNGLMNGLNLPAFCQFVNPLSGEPAQHLRILGSARFNSDMEVEFLNGKDLGLLLQNAWFSNRDTVITSDKKFKNANFQSFVTAEKLVNEVELQWLNKNYISLSRNQTITGSITFTAGSTFVSGIVATSLVEVTGAINGIQDLPAFVYESLDRQSDQVLQGRFTFEELIVPGDLRGIINNIDLEHDVLRYDVPANRVIGDKKFSHVTVDSLMVRRGATINGIDITEWYREAVACYPDIEMLVVKTPVVIPNGAMFSEGITTTGLVNGHILNKNTILLRHSDQTVSGSKQFLVYEQTLLKDPVMSVTNLRVALLEAFLNDLIMFDGNEKNVSGFVFNGRGLKFERQLEIKELSGKFVDSTSLVYGVDLPSLQRQIADFETVQMYYTMDEEFKYLDDLADILKCSIESRAQFLHHYEVVQNLAGYVSPDESYTSDILVQADGKTNAMSWNSEKMAFVYSTDVGSISDGASKISNEEIISEYKTSITSSKPDTNKILQVQIDNTECVLVLNTESELQCNLDIVTRTYTVINTYNTPGVVMANTAKTSSGTLIAFLLQQKSKRGLPIGSIVIYLITDLNTEHTPKLLQTLRPTRPTAITLITNTAPIIKPKKKYTRNVALVRSNEDKKISEENIQLNNDNTDLDSHEDFIIDDRYIFDNSSNDKGVFLAIASDRVQKAMHHGLVEIYRFDPSRHLFDLIQSVPSMAPLRVQFAVLPISHELVLYVMSRQQTRPLTIMLYEGVAGFKELFAASTVSHGSELATLTLENEHFVFIGDSNYTTVLRARFEGMDYL